MESGRARIVAMERWKLLLDVSMAFLLPLPLRTPVRIDPRETGP